MTFDGGGATQFGCISFYSGAHDQTWDGFNCAHGQATSTGVITFGGYAGLAAPHDIVMRNITILASCTGSATSTSAPTTDHAFYLSYAVGGPHDLLFEDITVDGAGYLASAFHFYHSDPADRNAWNVTVRRLHVTGTQQPIMLWDPTLRNITFDTADVRNALSIRRALRNRRRQRHPLPEHHLIGLRSGRVLQQPRHGPGRGDVLQRRLPLRPLTDRRAEGRGDRRVSEAAGTSGIPGRPADISTPPTGR